MATVATDTLFEWDQATDTWMTRAPYPTKRVYHEGGAYAGLLYVIDGSTDTGSTGAFNRWDPATDTWTALVTGFRSPEGIGAFVGGDLYVWSGQLDGLSGFDSRAFWWRSANPSGGWGQHTVGPNRTRAAAAVIGSKLYAAGGTYQPDGVLVAPVATDTLYEFTTAVLETSGFPANRGPMPGPRTGAAAAAIGTKLYVAGGLSDQANPATATSTLFEWDQATGTWSTKAAMPRPLQQARAVAIGTKLYVAGGWTPANLTVDTLLEWDQATDTWTEKARMPGAREFHSMGVIGTRLYVVAGLYDSARVPLPTAAGLWSVGAIPLRALAAGQWS